MHPSPERCRARLERFAQALAQQGCDGGVVYDHYNLCYLTGFLRGNVGVREMKFPLLLVFPGQEPLLFVSRGLREEAARTFTGELVEYEDYNIQRRMATYPDEAALALKGVLQGRPWRPRRIGFERRYLIAAYYDLLRELYPEAEWVDVSEILRGMRAIKDEDEVALIRRAGEIAAVGYATFRQEALPGRSEVEVYGLANAAVHREVGTFCFFQGDVASGERSVAGGGPATSRILQAGETLILDLWTTVNGYWSDTCRTEVVGAKPTPQQQRLFDAVLRALEAGEGKLRPGVGAAQVYRAVYEAFEEAGLASFFPHHAGHGIGLHPHEAPFLIPGSSEVLEEGMVVALEPGVYVPEVGGVRIEDNYLIRADGPQRLTLFPR